MILMVLFAEKHLTELLVPAIPALALFLVLFLLARRHSRGAPSIRVEEAVAPEAEEREHQLISEASPEQSAVYSHSYKNPLFLLLSAADSGQSAVLHSLRESLTEDSDENDARGLFSAAHFDHGVVMEVDSNLFLSSNNDNETSGWESFLDKLHKRRPQRPLDGVVLTVACNELVGQTALSKEQWHSRAVQMSRNLRLVRDRLGFSFPVYVLVTQCHSLRGFCGFAGTQFSASRRQILGWSNPYNLDASYHPAWPGQAFTYLGQVLEQKRIQSLADSANLYHRHASHALDDLFLFPINFKEMEGPISDFLEDLFRDSGHRDGLQFRGIYFSGDPKQESFEDGFLAAANGEKAAFVAELFEEKIFPERGLAYPVATALTPRNRQLWSVKTLCGAVALLLAFGTTVAGHNLWKTRERAVRDLQGVVEGLRKNAQPPEVHPAYQSIRAAQALSGGNFESVFVPFSLISDLDAQLRSTMPCVFEKLVYPGLRTELEGRTARLIPGRDTPPESLRDSPECKMPDLPIQQAHPSAHVAFDCKLTPVENGSAPKTAQSLASFVNTLLALEDNIVCFNGLAPKRNGSGSGMLLLASNLSSEAFADLPRQHTSTLDAIVRGSSGTLFDGSPWNIPAVNYLETIIAGELSKRMNEEQLLDTLSAIVNQINLLEQKESNESTAGRYQQLQNLNNSLAQAEKELAAPDLAWVAGDQFQLPPDVSQILAPVFARSPARNLLLCDASKEPQACAGLSELRLFLDKAASEHVSEFRTRLLSAQTRTTDKLMVIANGKLQLSPTTARLQTVLASFLKLPFVAHDGKERIRDVQPGQQLFWDGNKLQEALEDKAAYDRFVNEALANTPDSLQETMDDVALERLEVNMVDAIGSAQQFREKADLGITPEARAFAAAVEPLTRLLDQFSELNFEEDYQLLFQASTGHAFMILSRLDRDFDSQAFYRPPAGSLQQWTGATPPSVSVYKAQKPEDMMAYLTQQHGKLQSYLALAQPEIAFLRQQGPPNAAQLALIGKWAGIINEAQKYESAPASSSLGSLENYLSTEMDKTAPPDCTAPALPGGTAYFAQTQRLLEREIAARCHSLSHQTGRTQYRQLAEFFNQNLAGKFPFSPPMRTAEASVEADPNDVVKLFRRLDADGKAIQQALEQKAGENSSATAAMAAFVTQLESVRPLFAALLSGQADHGPMWDFMPLFRVNRSHELNGNQIIAWTLAAGNTTFRNSDPPKTGTWAFGQPVTLTLRWAKDSPNRPMPGESGAIDSLNKSVVFKYNDPWSLLRLLVEHTASSIDFDRQSDADPQTLAFTIGQQISPESAANQPQLQFLPNNKNAGTDSKVKVFITIRLFPPGKTTGLRLPVFPARAPFYEEE